MSAALIIQLLETFGPGAVSLIEGLIAKAQANGTVSSDEWAAYMGATKQTAKDRMLAMLQKAGIDPTSVQGTALLAAAS